MPGSSAGGFAEGLWGSIDKQRAEARYEEDRRSQREGNILQTLAEHGTPDVQALALQGLIQSANPKQWKKGLGGFLGQYQPNPAVGQLHALLQTPETVTRQVPSPDIDARATPMQPQAGPPAMGDQNPEATAQPLHYQPTPPPMLTETSQRSRRATYTPAEEAGMQVEAQGRGRIAGARAEMQAAGIPEAEQQQAILRMVGGRYGVGAHGAAGGVGEGNIVPDPDSPTGFSQVLYDKTTGREAQRTPAMDPAKAKTYRPVYKVMAKPDGRPGLFRLTADGEPRYIGDVPEKAQQIPVMNEDGSQTLVPVPPQWSTPGGPPTAQGAAAGAAPPPAAPQAGPPTAPGQAAATPPPGPATSGAGPAGGIRTKPTPLLSATDNANLGTPMGTRLSDVQGRVPLRPEDQQVIQDLDVGLANMARIRELTTKLFADPKGLAAKLSGATFGYSDAIGQDLNLATQRKSALYAELQGLIRGSLAGAARAQGEKGALSDKDITRYEQSFPDLGEGMMNLPDTKAMALARLDQLEQKMKTTRTIYQSGSPNGGGGGAAATPPGPGGVPAGGTFLGSQFPGYPPGRYVFKGYAPDGRVMARKIGDE